MGNILGRLVKLTGLLLMLANCGLGLSAEPVRPPVEVDSTQLRSPKPSDEQQLVRDRLALEREKLAYEKYIDDAKLTEEKNKTFWLSLATAVPLVATFLALVGGIITAIVAMRIHRSEAKLQFDLKTAEIIFSGVSHEAIHSRARALKKYFGARLSDDFAREFKPEEFELKKESPESKKFFCNLLLEHPKRREEIVELWFKLFPADYTWLARVNPKIWERVPEDRRPKTLEDKTSGE